VNTKDIVQFIIEKGMEDDKVKVEYPTLCGQSDAGKSKGNCKHHGHLSISVNASTAAEVMRSAFMDNPNTRMLLITYPDSIHQEVVQKIKKEK
jgi:hypothetical protein